MKFEAIRDYVSSCPLIDLNAPFHTDYNSATPVNYGLSISSPPQEISRNIAGRSTFRYGVMLHPKLSSINDAERLENIEHINGIWKWFRQQQKAENYPDPEEGEKVISVRAESPVPLTFESGAKTRLYSIQIYINYEEE